MDYSNNSWYRKKKDVSDEFTNSGDYFDSDKFIESNIRSIDVGKIAPSYKSPVDYTETEAPKQKGFYDRVEEGIKDIKSTFLSPSSSPSSSNYDDMFEEVKPKFWSTLGSKFMSGANAFDQALFNTGKNIVDTYNTVLDKSGYNKLMGIDKPLLNPFNSGSDYYKQTAKDYEVDTSNSSTPEKIAYWAAEQAPSFLATIPLSGAMATGKAGKALSSIDDIVASKVGGKLGSYAGNAAREGFENAAMDTAISTANGGDFNQNLRSAGEGFLGGAAFGTALKGIGDVAPKVGSRVADLATTSKNITSSSVDNIQNPNGIYAPKIKSSKVDDLGNTVYITDKGDTVRPEFLNDADMKTYKTVNNVSRETIEPIQENISQSVDKGIPESELYSPEYLSTLREPQINTQEEIPSNFHKDTSDFLNESYLEGVKDAKTQNYLTAEEAEKSMLIENAKLLLGSLREDTVKGVRTYNDEAGWGGQTRSAHPIIESLRNEGIKYSQIETALNNIINGKPLNPRDKTTPKLVEYIKQKLLEGDIVDTRGLTSEEYELYGKDKTLADNFNRIEKEINKPQIPPNEARIPLETAETKNVIDNTTKEQIASTKPVSEMALDNEYNGAPQGELKDQSWKDTVKDADITSPELKTLLEKTSMKYGVKHNDDVLEWAKHAIEEDEATAKRLVLGNSDSSAESNAIAQLLIKKYQDSGDYDDAIDIIERTSRKATSQGQAIQALGMWGRLTPEGMLRHIQRTFDNVNNDLLKQGKITKEQLKNAELNNSGFKSGDLSNLKDKEGTKSASMKLLGFADKLEPLKLTPGLVKKVVREMEEIQGMKEGYDKQFKTASLLADIEEMIPKSLARKISTFQTMAQLLNPKTAIRNVVGNGIFNVLENVSNVVSTPVDAMASLFTGKRTTSLPNPFTQAKGLGKGFREGLKEAWAGVNTKDVDGKFEIGRGGNTFKRNSVLGTAERVMGTMLQAPDRAFYQATYDDVIRQQMKVAGKGLIEPTESMKQLADYMAKYRTFQDDNELSKGMKNIKSGLNGLSAHFTGTKEFGLGDLVLKYAKTPANIVARGIDYTPLGLIRAAVNPQYGGKLTQKEFVDQLGRSLTGTGVAIAGYELGKLGIITGSAPEDYNQAAFEKQIGKTPYSINFDALKRYRETGNKEDAKPQKGDKFTTWDWAAPTSILFGIGADVGSTSKDTTAATAIIDGLSTGMSSFVEQPVFTGVQKAFSQKDPVEGLKEIGLGAMSSFMPVLGKQGAQTLDNTTRSTYDPSKIQQSLNQAKAKIPVKNQELEPSINTFGEERQNYESEGLSRIKDIFLNPGYTNTYNPTTTTDKIQNIFDATGDKSIFPDVAKKEITLSGNKIKLTAKEYTWYQQELGRRTMDMLNTADTSTSDNNIKDITGNVSEIDKQLKEDIFMKRGYQKVKQGRKTLFLEP